jgi:hypothetical protein
LASNHKEERSEETENMERRGEISLFYIELFQEITVSTS